MIADLIALLFLSRDYAHREHLRTSGIGSYAKHKALEEFYEEIVDLTDTLTETYQGRHGIVEDVPYMDCVRGLDAVATLEQHLSFVETMRYQAISREDTAIQNIVDEIVGRYLRTLYKLRNLS
jgi:hypothetical protein